MATEPVDIDQYLEECTKIEPMALQEEFVRVPADLAFWNGKYANVYQHWLEMKLAREICFAKLWQHHQTQLLINTPKGKATISEVEAAVFQDAEYIDAKVKEITAEGEKVRLYGIMDSLRSKRDMLISLGAHQRAEMGNDPMLRKQAYLEAEVRNHRDGG